MNLLDIRNLKVKFETARGSLQAVRGVSMSAGAGEVVGLVGESGCGKTMSALSLMGLVPANGSSEGEAFFEGRDLLELPDKERRSVRGDRISMIFQEPMIALNPVLTVGFQLCEPLILHRGASGSDAEKRALEVLDLVQVPNAAERMKSYPHQLSGGLCQRVMIAMALICEPKLLIADEPTTALDVTIQAQILSLLGDLKNRLGTSILMITHDLGVIAELCDKVYVMYAGYIVEAADVFALFDKPLHPYTAGLMRSIPGSGGRSRKKGGLYSIPGMVPSPEDIAGMQESCPFAPRCAKSMDICWKKLPELLHISQERSVRCWLYGHERTSGFGNDSG